MSKMAYAVWNADIKIYLQTNIKIQSLIGTK